MGVLMHCWHEKLKYIPKATRVSIAALHWWYDIEALEHNWQGSVDTFMDVLKRRMNVIHER